MILNRIKLEDIVTIDGVNFQNVVIDAIVDKEADLPLPSALSSQSYIIVAPSTCHCTKESTNWEMDSNGDWYKQMVQTSGGGGGGGGVIYIGDYYTKTEVDNLIADFVDETEVQNDITAALTNYYTSAQVDALLPDMTNYYTKSETYSKAEVDALIPTIPSTYDADDITYDNATSGLAATDVQNALDELAAAIPSIPSNYDADDIVYDNTTSGLTATNVQDALDEVVSDLPDMSLYYTSSQTDSVISTALSGYYTSAQVDSAISTALSGYYTSVQVDSLLGSYYTSAQTDSAIASYWTTNITNYYTKSEVDALIPTVPSTYDADDITYDNSTSGLTATNAQDAIDEVVATIPTIPSTYDADDIDYDNTTSGLTATDVQSAIDELAQGGYTLPIASASTLGGVKVGTGLSIDADGVLSASGGGGTPTRYWTYNKMLMKEGTIYNVSTNFSLTSASATGGLRWYFARNYTTAVTTNTPSELSDQIQLKPNTTYYLYGTGKGAGNPYNAGNYYIKQANTDGSLNPTWTALTWDSANYRYSFTTNSIGIVMFGIQLTSASRSGTAIFDQTVYPRLLETDQNPNDTFEPGYPWFCMDISNATAVTGGTSTSNAKTIYSLYDGTDKVYKLSGYWSIPPAWITDATPYDYTNYYVQFKHESDGYVYCYILQPGKSNVGMSSNSLQIVNPIKYPTCLL